MMTMILVEDIPSCFYILAIECLLCRRAFKQNSPPLSWRDGISERKQIFFRGIILTYLNISLVS